jgi:choline transport protein
MYGYQVTKFVLESVSTIGLVNGGTAGLIWMFFVCWIGFLLVNTTMAEMASM